MAHLVDNPASFPGLTVFGNGGRCVLIGDLPNGGDVYIGDAEMSTIAPLLDYASPAQVAQWKQRIATLEAEIAAARAALDRIRGQVLAEV